MTAAAILLVATALLLASCGGHGAPPTGKRKIVVAALGDSITAGSPAYDPDPKAAAYLGFGSDVRSQWEYWAAKADSRLDFRNCGVYGERTDQIARRLEGCARGAQVLIVQGGINDIAQGRRARTAADGLRAMVRRGKALGLRVGLADVLPWNNGHPRFTARVDELNRLIARLGHDERVPVLPFHHALADPSRPGRMPAEFTVDGDHPDVAGYRRLGNAFSLP